MTQNIRQRKTLASAVQEQHPRLRKSILDSGFHYRPSHATDIRDTFHRLAKAAVVLIKRDRS